MYLNRAGSGPQIFLGLHGWSGDHRTFEPLTRELPEEATFFSADLPGCGKSKPPRHWTVAAIADEIAESAWGLAHPFTLAGNCSGALLAIAAAQRLGNRVERLVLIDIFATFPWYFRVFLSKVIGRYAYYSTFANPVGRLITNFSLKHKRSAETNLTEGFSRIDHASAYNYLRLFESFPQPETFEGLTQPIDIVYGDRTFQAVRESAIHWRRVWPQAKIFELKNAGHLPILEATAQLRNIVFQEGAVPANVELPDRSSRTD